MTVQTEPQRRDLLEQGDAEARAPRVSGCGYILEFDLRRGAAAYRGDVTIRFQHAGSGDLFLDYRGTRIERERSIRSEP